MYLQTDVFSFFALEINIWCDVCTCLYAMRICTILHNYICSYLLICEVHFNIISLLHVCFWTFLSHRKKTSCRMHFSWTFEAIHALRDFCTNTSNCYVSWWGPVTFWEWELWELPVGSVEMLRLNRRNAGCLPVYRVVLSWFGHPSFMLGGWPVWKFIP